MNIIDTYKKIINEIFSCLDRLEQGLTSEEQLNYISGLREYKDVAVNFKSIIEQYEKNSEAQQSSNNQTISQSEEKV